MDNLEDEFKNLDNLVNEMKEGMQEEFATIKFEVNNAIVDVKREVDVKLSLLKRDFEKDLIALTTELNEMKKPNWNLKYGIIGFMFAMVVVFISYRI
jgi:capsule polysaccharide export protein KpsE/RkpR